jgi:hypothetical protein
MAAQPINHKSNPIGEAGFFRPSSEAISRIYPGMQGISRKAGPRGPASASSAGLVRQRPRRGAPRAPRRASASDGGRARAPALPPRRAICYAARDLATLQEPRR